MNRPYLKFITSGLNSLGKKERLNNFSLIGSDQLVSASISVDENGNQTVASTFIDRAGKKETTKTDTPDSTLDAVSISYNGRLQTSTPATPQDATVYSYDALGRTTSVTDPVSGTTTSAYNSLGQLISQSQGSNTTVFEYFTASQVNAGRLKAQTNPAGKKAYFSYSLRGELLRTWGAATYPIEYVYDSYGQRTEMRTFRGGSGWSSSLWPTTTGTADVTKWIYHEATGLLKEKECLASIRWSFVYNDRGEVTSGKRYWSYNTLVAGQQFEYDFDNLGNRKTAKHGGDASGNNLRQSDYTSNNLNQISERMCSFRSEV